MHETPTGGGLSDMQMDMRFKGVKNLPEVQGSRHAKSIRVQQVETT